VGAEQWSQEEQTKAARILKQIEEKEEGITCCMEYKGSEKGKL
jgi:hypothetical protein